MKKETRFLIKDLFVSVLIVICLILIFSVIFYNKISLSKIVPKMEEYKLTNEMKKDINETYEQDTQIVSTYYLDAADLKQSEKTKEYNKGKKNPFAEESEAVDTTNNTDLSNNNSTSNTNTFYEDDGTK